jgi:hypothetical protein
MIIALNSYKSLDTPSCSMLSLISGVTLCNAMTGCSRISQQEMKFVLFGKTKGVSTVMCYSYQASWCTCVRKATDLWARAPKQTGEQFTKEEPICQYGNRKYRY